MFTNTVLLIKKSHLDKLAILFIGMSVLTGCESTPPSKQTSKISVNKYVPENHVQKERLQEKQDDKEIGKIFIGIETGKHNPLSIWINDLPIATHSNGYIRLPLYPGNYVLKSNHLGSSSTHELKFSIKKDENKYFGIGGDFSDMVSGYPLKEKGGLSMSAATIGDGVGKLSWKEFWSTRSIALTTPRHKLLPESMKTKVDNCLAKQTLEACSPVYEDIPLALINLEPREKIVNLVETETAKRKQEATDKALRASLSKDALRDHYMIALSNALSNREFDKSLPIFEKLKGLNMPLDPDFNYFYGEALHETGKNTKALGAITSYIRNKGSQATYYQESLQLLNKIQSTM